MRLRNIKGANQKVAEYEAVINQPENNKGKWNTVFQNENPISLEIGMGKGRFILDMAKKYPDRNFIGIEKYTSVLLRAIEKLELNECYQNITNVKFLCVDAVNIEEYFQKGEIDKIYLNFSDPWPKDRHAKRRLQSRQFLSRYDKVLKDKGTIEFKTDNRKLFDFSLEEAKPAGWSISSITYDLHQDSEMMKDNIMTEYEEKFSGIGNPIYKSILIRLNN